MSAELRYTYADGDLLEARAQYSYSAFQGAAFLDAWRRQRASVARARQAGTKAAAAVDDEPLLGLLAQVARGLEARPAQVEALAVLRRLLQRFEVSKRLHGRYDESWRPVDPADYHGPERYLRFAELLDLAYVRTGELPFLNALLKCIDTLSSLAPGLEAAQTERLRILLASEESHVGRLPRGARASP